MDHSYGLLDFWSEADWVSRSVALGLITMSLTSWYVIVTKILALARLRRTARIAVNEFWHSRNFAEGLQLLNSNKERNPFYALAVEGAEAAAHHRQNKDDLHGALNVSDWLISCLRRSIDEASAKLQSGLSVLASVGSTAPFVGLFGTVWGIYHALAAIGTTGSAGLDQVAGPVGEALIMTALGLAVAIPAVLGYNALVRANKAMLGNFSRFSHDLHAYLITGARVGGQTTPAFSSIAL